MNLHLILFAAGATALLGIGAFYIASCWKQWQSWEIHSKRINIIIFVFLILEASGFLLLRLFPTHFGQFKTFYWIIYTILGLFANVFFYTLILDISLRIKNKAMAIFSSNNTHSINIERRGVLLTGGLALGSSVAGAVQLNNGPKVYNVDIPIKNLPSQFEGFKIAQITDLHIGPTIGKEYTEHVVNITNGLNPDLIALTGDFIDGTVSQLRDAVSALAHLKAKEGVFYTTGNHEYIWGAVEWIETFKQMGIRPLINEHVLIERNQAQFILAGITDPTAINFIREQASDVDKALEGTPKNLVKILLAHQPISYKQASPAGFDLQLSGHTHAGQFFPFNIFVMFAQRYYKGLNRHENMWVYVSRGTGYWGPPTRLGVPSEITLLHLKRA
ncbi:MAG: metallophosphoesterase [Pseudomonadota bacterium]